MSKFMTKGPRLDEILKSGKPLPTDAELISKGLEILQFSPHGQQLAEFAVKEKVDIRLMATPKEHTYLPDSKIAYIGFNRNSPLGPARFVLMLTSLLREAQQEAAGVTHPPLHVPRQEHLKTSMAKYEDCVWYMCTVACELADQEIFSEYNFLDELRKMGHNETIELYLKQERRN
jgi:hypothetical protein